MDLGRLINVLWKHKLFMLAAILAGLIIAGLSLYSIKMEFRPNGIPSFEYRAKSLTVYETHMNLIIDVPGFGIGSIDGGIEKGIQLAPTYAYLSTSDAIMDQVVQESGPLQATVESGAVLKSPVITINVQGKDPHYISHIAALISGKFVSYLTEEQAANKIPAEKRIIVRPLGPPSSPAPLESRKIEIAIILFLVPIILASIISFALENLSHSTTLNRKKLSIEPLLTTNLTDQNVVIEESS